MSTQKTPLELAAERVGDRWSLLIVDSLLASTQRFSDLQAAVRGIAPNILTRRLDHLAAEGLVTTTPYSTRPPRHACCSSPAQWARRRSAPASSRPLAVSA